jgi:hypothetical protein
MVSATGQKILRETIQEAQSQIAQYHQVEEIKGKTRLKKWIVAFSGNTSVYSEEIDCICVP